MNDISNTPIIDLAIRRARPGFVGRVDRVFVCRARRRHRRAADPLRANSPRSRLPVSPMISWPVTPPIFAKDLKAAINALDETRTRIKKPVLHTAQRMRSTDPRKKLSESATAAVLLVEARITEYLRVKEAKARAEAEAARLQAEAELKVAEALMSPIGRSGSGGVRCL